jgi:competence protein ComEC
LSWVEKHAHFWSAALRNTLSLSLAVNIALLPLLLYHFQQFPLLSLGYNLFIPFLISATFFCTLLSLLLSLVWTPLAKAAFWFTDRCTDQILTFIAYPPTALDYVIALKGIPSWTIPLYLFGLFCLALQWREKSEEALFL